MKIVKTKDFEKELLKLIQLELPGAIEHFFILRKMAMLYFLPLDIERKFIENKIK